MTSEKEIHIINCHAEGEVGDVIVGGVAPPPGETLWNNAIISPKTQQLRDYVLLEPRGGVFRHVNLLVPPKDKRAAVGFIIMEPEDTPPMSGSNSICVATVVLERGLHPMREPITELTLEAPGGLVRVHAHCESGKVKQVSVQNLPSFVVQQEASLEVPNLPTQRVDIAYGGDSFVIVPLTTAGLKGTPDEAHRAAQLGMQIVRAANEQLGFVHPENPDWRHISFCLFAGEITPNGGPKRLLCRIAGSGASGKIDRSPTGTAVSARMALPPRSGQDGSRTNPYPLTASSIIGSRFVGRIVGEARVGDRPAIIPEISGRAWVTGETRLTLDSSDPFPRGYKLSDTWPSS